MHVMPHLNIFNLSYSFSDGTELLSGISTAITPKRIGLVGKNGVGKTTLFKLILGQLKPSAGSIDLNGQVAYCPQNVEHFDGLSVAQVLEVDEKLSALSRILSGSTDEADFDLLGEDWSIEARIESNMAQFGLEEISLDRDFSDLSGGQQTRLLLVRTFLTDADFVLLDEPTNNLDQDSREKLYDLIRQWPKGLIIISHDRALLNLMNEIVELSTLGLKLYGGNYDAYFEQKHVENAAITHEIEVAKKQIKKRKSDIQAMREKHEQKQAHGRRLRRTGSLPKMVLDAMKGQSENTQSRLLTQNDRMMEDAESRLKSALEKQEVLGELSLDLSASEVPNGKVVLEMDKVSFAYPGQEKPLIQDYSLKLVGPERVALCGENGRGKTTLVKLMLGDLQPDIGEVAMHVPVHYLDQSVSLLEADLSILENFYRFNLDLNVTEAQHILARFLFRNTAAHKKVKDLSGGEKLRAMLACILMSKKPPKLLILDEPTNHLDLESLAHLESALCQYQGALLVISHDACFLENIGIREKVFL